MRSVYASGALWLLMLVSTLNFLDRQIASILAEPIKRELLLSDTQIGLMTGLAFSAFYTIVGIPIARYSDRPSTNRSRLIAIMLAIWSTMTALCGLAQNFGQLLAARIGVGAGEAGCTPPSHSLISDSYPLAQRPQALAFYGMGLPLGSLLGLSLGGLLADAFGWREAFLILGLPGIALGLVVWRYVPEPRTVWAKFERDAMPAEHVPPSFKDLFAELMASRAFLLLMAAFTLGSFLSYGKGVWQAVFMIRIHHLSPGVAGVTLGLVAGIGTGVGAWAGGWCASRYGAKNRKHILTVVVMGLIASVPLSLIAYSAPDWRVAAFFLLAGAVASGLSYGPVFTCLQGIVRPSSRGGATAVFLLVQNLVGLGFGPLLFGVLSDAITPWAGGQSVRYVLYAAALLGPIPAFLFWRTSLRLNAEMRQ
ncbi:MAG: MFS transporter [Sphingomonas sp.]|uniref:spinster family MFS transporter n=1 Tax=Sphingomonas sp. TaxID=28214 RepID=UPI001AD2660D|nr:MFS transporter [Sphingomonas sp.]MBN8814337.1 MFS transporter [Sphingomonas sp.]